MGARAVVYYMVTTLIAVFIGIVMVMIIRPGRGSRDSPVLTSKNIEPVQATDAFLDLIRYLTAISYLHLQHFRCLEYQTGGALVCIHPNIHFLQHTTL